jgi:hypothetical protein
MCRYYVGILFRSLRHAWRKQKCGYFAGRDFWLIIKKEDYGDYFRGWMMAGDDQDLRNAYLEIIYHAQVGADFCKLWGRMDNDRDELYANYVSVWLRLTDELPSELHGPRPSAVVSALACHLAGVGHFRQEHCTLAELMFDAAQALSPFDGYEICKKAAIRSRIWPVYGPDEELP